MGASRSSSARPGIRRNRRKRSATPRRRFPIVLAPNFSVGVNTLFWLTRKAAELLGDGFDVEIVETHHRLKKDSPERHGQAARRGGLRSRGLDYERDVAHGRAGLVGERPAKQIGMHAIRGGDVVGDHTVIFAATGERLELTHKASSRETFAVGALRAARWIVGQPSGLYSMEDVLGLNDAVAMRAGIALGSNVGDRLANLQSGARGDRANRRRVAAGARFADLRNRAGRLRTRRSAVSSTRSSRSASTARPSELLARACDEIERQLGRPSLHPRNVSRTIDLDLLYFGDSCGRHAGRCACRIRACTSARFVLQPLADIRPELVLPNQQQAVARLARAARRHVAVGADRGAVVASPGMQQFREMKQRGEQHHRADRVRLSDRAAAR